MSMNQFKELELDEKAQQCLALCYLRLIDLDILSSSSKVRVTKLTDRESFLKILGTTAPVEIRNLASHLNGPLSQLLATRCSEVSSIAHRAMILSELTFSEPWTGKKFGLLPLKIDDGLRRLVLKEIATLLQFPNSNENIDKIIEVTLLQGRAEVRDYGKILKVGALTATGTIIGGLVLAPHIGGALGAGMGLSGAAATSAGLAALGFGSIASGGFGMAGGMLIVGAVSGTLGAGVGSIAAGANKIHTDAAIEAQKLRVTLTLLNDTPPGGTEIAARIISALNEYEQSVNKKIGAARSAVKPDKSLLKSLNTELRLLKTSKPR